MSTSGPLSVLFKLIFGLIITLQALGNRLRGRTMSCQLQTEDRDQPVDKQAVSAPQSGPGLSEDEAMLAGVCASCF